MFGTKKKKDGAISKKRKEESRYIRMVRTIFKVCKRQCVPLYSSRFSRKDFTLWQHIALIALMQRVRKSYREYVDDYLTTTERLRARDEEDEDEDQAVHQAHHWSGAE